MSARPERSDPGRELPDADGRHETANGHGAERKEVAVVVEPAAGHDDPARAVRELPATGSAGERSGGGPTAAARPAGEPGAGRTAGVAAGERVEGPAAVRERPGPSIRAVLYALPAILVAVWVVAFVPPGLALVLGALAALPVAIVAVPWLVGAAVAAVLDR